MLTEKIQLEPDETILIQVRKHWFVLYTQLFVVILVACIPLIAYIACLRYGVFSYVSVSMNTPFLIALYSGWLIFAWMGFFSVWTNYYLDVWTITNKRLIAVDQRGLFNRSTGSFRLERLQDINVTIQGIIPTFLDFGNLEAETASNDKEFVARAIPKPQELKALILSAADAITYNGGGRPPHGTEV